MPFHIPTLDEARKKHETSAKTLAVEKPPSKNKSTSANNNTTAPKSKDNNAISSHCYQSHQNKNNGNNSKYDHNIKRPQQQQQQQTKSFQITNPYAKKRKVTSDYVNQNSNTSNTAKSATSTIGLAASSSASSVTNNSNNYKNSYNNNTNISAGNNNSTTKKLFIPNSTGKSYTSFAEAFGDNNNNNNSNSIENTTTTTTTTFNENGNNNNNINQININDNETNINTFKESLGLREHHAFLQPHVLNVSTRQRGNPIIQYIKNVPIEYNKMTPDYIMSSNRCTLFLSCKYHNLHPQYIHKRIADLRKDFDLRVLLCLVDIQDNASTILFLNKLALLNNMTLVLSWSEEEAARYLETFKAYESKDASIIQRKEKETYVDQITDVLCAIPSVNKTDSIQLISQFGSLNAVMNADVDELSLCPGVGEKKVKRLFDAFHKPFSSSVANNKKNNSSKTALDHDDK